MVEIKYPFLELATVNAPYMDALDDAARRIIHSGRYVGGEAVADFERELADFCCVPNVVGVSNGLDALRLIFRAYIEMGRLASGDEVIVPANTYIASVLAITDNGLRPIFVEPDERTMNLDTSLLEASIGPKTKAILTVHLYGRVCYDKAIADVVERHGLILVEDNAQAIDAEAAIASPWGTVKTGSLGHAAAFSFYPTKNLGALGDGGAVATHDADLAAIVRVLANYGADYRYHNIYQGYNCRLDPIQAAFLSVKLKTVHQETARRRYLAAVYNNMITNNAIVKPMTDDPDLAVWHQYVVHVAKRDEFRRYLADNGVGTDIHYATPPHRQPCYHEFAGLNLPVTDKLAAEIVSLPISLCTSEHDAMDISDIINRFAI